MRLFTLFTYLKTKESHDRWITRRVSEFRQQISKAKYPKISQKYRSKISGRFRRTPLHCTEIKTLQVSVIRRSGYVYPEKSKRPLLPSGYRISGCKMSAHGTSSFPIRMWDIRMKNVGAQNSWKSHSADSIFYPNMLSGCPSMVYPDALFGYTPYMDSKELSSISDLLWWSKSYQNTKT